MSDPSFFHTSYLRWAVLLALPGLLLACESPVQGPGEPARTQPSLEAVEPASNLVHSLDPPILVEPPELPVDDGGTGLRASTTSEGEETHDVVVLSAAVPDEVPSNGRLVVTSSFAEAVDLVAAGGTIQVMSGRYVVNERLRIDKPMTVVAVVPDAVIEVREGDLGGVLLVQGVEDGTVRFEGLTFELLSGRVSGVVGQLEWDRIEIENCDFLVASDQTRLPLGFAGELNGNPELLIRNTRVSSVGEGRAVVNLLLRGGLFRDDPFPLRAQFEESELVGEAGLGVWALNSRSQSEELPPADLLTVDATDNVVAGADIALFASRNPGEVDFHSSDVDGTTADIAGDAWLDGALTCNWWGSQIGPTTLDNERFAPPDPAVFTPWALQPVAGTSTTDCEGSV